MRRILITTLLFLSLSLLLGSALLAQSSTFSMPAWHITGMGGESTALGVGPQQTTLLLQGHLDSVDTTHLLQGDGFRLRSGFSASVVPVEFKQFIPMVAVPSPTPIISLPTGTPDLPGPGPGPGRPTREP